MDKSKLIAIVVLVLGIGCIAFFKEKPLPAEGDDHDDTPAATVQAPPADSKPFDAAGGVTKLKSEDLHVGDGTAAKTGDDVSVNYRGTLLNGEMFDESYGRGPFDFKLGAGGVIKGWDKGVVGMKVGGKRKLTVPADLAYGNNSPSPKIPAGATLVFEVELLKVNGKS